MVSTPTQRWQRLARNVAPQLMSLDLVQVAIWPMMFRYIMEGMSGVCKESDTRCVASRDHIWLYIYLILVFLGAIILINLVTRVVRYKRTLERPVSRYSFRLAGLVRAHVSFQTSCIFMVFLSYPSVFFPEYNSWLMLRSSCVLGFFMLAFYAIGVGLYLHEVIVLFVQYQEIGISTRHLERVRRREERETRVADNNTLFETHE